MSENLTSHAKSLTDPIKVFHCYAREDEASREQLSKHLKSMEREELIVQWYDRKISAGKDFKQEILLHIDTSDILLALISPAFMSSDYCNDIELCRALDKHILGEIRVIPIILRPVDWQRTPLGELQALPRNGRPIIKWKPTDYGWKSVAEGIRQVVEELQAAKPTFNTKISSDLEKRGLKLLYRALSMSSTLKEAHLSDSFEELKQAVRFDPENINAWAGIARALYHMQKYEEAILACERVLSASYKGKFYDGIYEIKVYSLQHIGKFEEAQKLIKDYESYIMKNTRLIPIFSPFQIDTVE